MREKEIKASALVYGSFTRCKTVKKKEIIRAHSGLFGGLLLLAIIFMSSKRLLYS